MFKFGLQRDGVGQFLSLDPPLDRLVDAAVQGIGKMIWQQKLGHALVGTVIGQ